MSKEVVSHKFSNNLKTNEFTEKHKKENTKVFDWMALSIRVRELSLVEGTNKASSGYFTVKYPPCWDDDFYVEIGGYDIGDWNRHTVIGPYKSEHDLYKAVLDKIVQAENEIINCSED